MEKSEKITTDPVCWIEISRHIYLLVAILFFFSTIILPQTANACDNCGCEPVAHGTTISPPESFIREIHADNGTIRRWIREQHQITTNHIREEFEDLEEFLVDEGNPTNPDTIFGGYLLPAWMMMTEQLVHTAMDQMLILGALFDAKQQLETQTLFQKLEAEAHKDYHPSHEMCVLGTNMRSLAETERNYEFTTFVMSQRSIDRQMGNANTAASRGQFDDHCFRLRQFRKRYCNPRDNNDHLQLVCEPEGEVAYPECMPDENEATADSKNKDIDFTRTVDKANTLEIDFYTDGQTEATEDEEDVFALASNLYSHDIMFRIPEAALRQRGTQDELLDMRNVIAKRSVAEHSFNTIVGMKAMSKEEALEVSQPYMRLILEAIGLGDDGDTPEEEIEMYLGERPSYYAQMELLTKRIFQSPDFYINLYDEPANVERMGVALQAIGLMQDFDTWQSYLRTEAMLSVVMELELLRLNNQVANQMGSMRSGGFEL